MSNRPVHFEISADDPERAAEFYRKAFGWKIEKWDGPIDYWLVTTGEKDTPGIDGGLGRREQPGWQVVNVIAVDAIDEAVTSVEEAGGSIVVPKMHIPTVGWVAYFADTEGNVSGIIQPDPMPEEGCKV